MDKKRLERELIKDHTSASERRALLLSAHAILILHNTNTGNALNPILIQKFLENVIPPKNDTQKPEAHSQSIRRLLSFESSTQSGDQDNYYENFYNEIKEKNLKDLGYAPPELSQKVIDFIPEMIMRDMFNIILNSRKMPDNYNNYDYIIHLVKQAENIGLKPITKKPEFFKDTITIFRPSIFYAGHPNSISGGKIEFHKEIPGSPLSFTIDSTIEDVIIEKHIGILTERPDGNLVLLSQTTPESNQAFQNTQTLWDINYDFGKAKSGSYKTMTYKPSYFNNQWFVLTSCEDASKYAKKQFYVGELPVSTHIAASQYVDVSHLLNAQLAIQDTNKRIDKAFQTSN